jgi:TPR repeat protein
MTSCAVDVAGGFSMTIQTKTLGLALGLLAFAAAGPALARSADPVVAKAQAGEAWSQTMLALELRDGVNGPANPAEAMKWLRKAAAQDFTPAEVLLGSMYADGDGAPQDYRQAMIWLHRAADKGFPEAQIQVGKMYSAGLGVRQDAQTAAYWFKAAARQGDDEGLQLLSAMNPSPSVRVASAD